MTWTIIVYGMAAARGIPGNWQQALPSSRQDRHLRQVVLLQVEQLMAKKKRKAVRMVPQK
jgi:hypothetical protein